MLQRRSEIREQHSTLKADPNPSGKEFIKRMLSSILFHITQNLENSQAKERQSFKELVAEDILIIS